MPPSPPKTQIPELLVRLDEKLDAIDEQVKSINLKLYGNGKPGLLIDQDRMMNQIDQLIKIAATNANNIKNLQSETPGKWFAKNWKSILLITTAFFIILHSFIPADVSLWSWFAKIIGGVP